MKLSFAPFAPLPAGGAAPHQAGGGQNIDAQMPSLFRAVADLAGRAYARIIQARKQARDSEVLAHMTDRELADIGLSRSDLGRVHDPAFAADFGAGRAASQSLKWL